jgi:hypothetical protein
MLDGKASSSGHLHGKGIERYDLLVDSEDTEQKFWRAACTKEESYEEHGCLIR